MEEEVGLPVLEGMALSQEDDVVPMIAVVAGGQVDNSGGRRFRVGLAVG